MAVQNKDITYINKSFNDIRSQLINFSQTYSTLSMERSLYIGKEISFLKIPY